MRLRSLFFSLRLFAFTCLINAAIFAEGAPLPKASPKISSVFAKHGIRVYTADQPEAAAALNGLLGPTVLSEIKEILPFTIYVENRGVHSIAEIVTGICTKSSTGERSCGFGQTGPGGKGIVTGGFMIQVHSQELTSVLMRVARQTSKRAPDLQGAKSRFFSQVFGIRPSPGVVEVSLDAVRLSNGTVLGPDESGVVERSRARLRVFKELADRFADSAVSDADLAQWLQSNADRGPFVGPGGRIDQYLSLRGSMTATIHQDLASRGRAAITQFLLELATNEQKTQLISVKE